MTTHVDDDCALTTLEPPGIDFGRKEKQISSSPIRVIIDALDDRHFLRIHDVLKREHEVSIVGRAASERELADAIRELRPDAVVHATDADTRVYRERIVVQVGTRWITIQLRDVNLIRASGVYVDMVVNGRVFTVRESLRVLEAELDPREFMRIHRSAIVRLRRIESFRRLPTGDGELCLADGVTLRVSRARRAPLEQWLGLRP